MKTANLSSGDSGSLSNEPKFSADFAERVLRLARQRMRRRRVRNRIAVAAGVLLLVSATPLVKLLRVPQRALVANQPAFPAAPAWRPRWNDEALTAYELAESTAPRSAGDYLLPNAAALTSMTSAYRDISER